MTDDKIFIGFPVLENVGEFNEALGVSADSGDTREYVRLLVKDLNARGGLAGREVVAVTHTYDANSAETEAQRDQAACSTWTQDNRVFAALIPAVRTPTLFTCLTRANVAIIATGPMTVLDDTDYTNYPGLVTTTAASLHETARLMVDGLLAEGYYEPESPTGDITVGLVRFDHPSHRRVTEEVLKPGLARHGIRIEEEAEIQALESNDTIGQSVAQVQNAVLRFQSRGVDHVLLLDEGAGLFIFFPRFAENQGYRPQYGVTSLSAPHIVWATGAVAEAQVRTTIGVGWYAPGDVAPRERPRNARSDRCMELMRDGGAQMGDENAEGIAQIYCDRVWLTEAGVSAAQGPLGLASFVRGVESLGDRYLPPGGLGTRFEPGRRDGARRWAPMAFNTDCSCFRYTGRVRS